MRTPLALVALIVLTTAAPLGAQTTSPLAPADRYFGRFRLSVLAIANTIRDAGLRFEAGTDPHVLIDGPLAFATDAIAAWEKAFPNDPWIARDLLAMHGVYTRLPGDDAVRLARKTIAWLLADFPQSPEALKLRAARDGHEDDARAEIPAVSPWERFAALRAPLPPAH